MKKYCDLLLYNRIQIICRLAAGPGWELPSHQGLVPSRSWSWLGVGPGAPIPQRFGPIPSHEKKFGPIPVLSHPGSIPRQEMCLVSNIYINIRTIQLMNISLESAH